LEPRKHTHEPPPRFNYTPPSILMARCVAMTHRGPLTVPPCKTVWFPRQAVWQPRNTGRRWVLWRPERASTRVPDYRLAYASRSSPGGCFVPVPSTLPFSAASLARRWRLLRSESSRLPASLSLSPAARGQFLSPLGSAPPKQPCRVSTCVTLYARGGPPPSSQSPQCDRTTSTTLSPGAPVLVSSRRRHASSRVCLAPVLTSALARPPPFSGCPRVRR
jgi:hypothetical protein